MPLNERLPWDDAARARRVRRSWALARWRDALTLGPLWRWLARLLPAPIQCRALSPRKNYCQKVSGHFGPHLSAIGEEWKS